MGAPPPEGEVPPPAEGAGVGQPVDTLCLNCTQLIPAGSPSCPECGTSTPPPAQPEGEGEGEVAPPAETPELEGIPTAPEGVVAPPPEGIPPAAPPPAEGEVAPAGEPAPAPTPEGTAAVAPPETVQQFNCPTCGTMVTRDMAQCPGCSAPLAFE